MRKPPWPLEHLIEDILFFVCRIEWKTSGHTFESFSSNTDLKDIVSNNFIKFGEACARIINHYPEITQKYPNIPWLGIKETRNLVAHLYERINWEEVWKNIEELPSLRGDILHIIEKEKLKARQPENLDRYEPRL